MLLNVRIMVTRSQSLEGRAQGGLFNSELLSKLNVFRIEMPSLAKRGEEFDDIVLGIVGEITRELHKEHLRTLSDEAWQDLRDYAWPGNLRELRNVLRLAVVAAKGDRIEKADLPAFGHDRIDFRATREQFEKIYILELMKTFDWQIDKTCRMTRMDKDALLAKMSQYGITAEGHPSH
jgi:two-component system response regulator HydG